MRRIETARLVLEPIPLASARALLGGCPVTGLVAAPGWPSADTLHGLALDVATEDPSRTGWFVTLAGTGQVIGDCGWRGGPDCNGDAELGYGLAAPFRGFGYGTEAVGGMVRWCATQPGVLRLIAEVRPGNTPSRRLLERLGFALIEAGGEHLRYAYRVTQDPGLARRTGQWEAGPLTPRPGPAERSGTVRPPLAGRSFLA